MYSRIIIFITSPFALACGAGCLIYWRKAVIAKAHSNMRVAVNYTNKAYYCFYAMFGFMALLALFALPTFDNLLKQIIFLAIIAVMLIVVLPSQKKEFTKDLLEVKKEEKQQEDNSFIDKSVWYIFSRLQLGWGIALLVLFFMGWFVSKPEDLESYTVLSTVILYLILFALGIPVTLIQAWWKSMKLKKKKKDEKSGVRS